MQFPDLSPLPIWAQVLVYSIFAVSLAVIIGMARLGLIQGKKAGASEPGKAEVAAMVVDSSAIRAATAAVEGLTVSITSLGVATKALAEQQKATADELDSVREEMRIHREISRRS
ncbi:hypothetical protein [Devosia sp. Naph2]|uniref:hypothetical protein n=1 Tax=Devosia polycyclovorans TaxID=3345148 RepID=UPI0035CF9B59